MKVFVSYCNERSRLECLLGCLSVSVPPPNGIALLVAIFVRVISDPFYSASHQWFWLWGCWKTWRIFNVVIYCVEPWTMKLWKTNKPLAFLTKKKKAEWCNLKYYLNTTFKKSWLVTGPVLTTTFSLHGLEAQNHFQVL